MTMKKVPYGRHKIAAFSKTEQQAREMNATTLPEKIKRYEKYGNFPVLDYPLEDFVEFQSVLFQPPEVYFDPNSDPKECVRKEQECIDCDFMGDTSEVTMTLMILVHRGKASFQNTYNSLKHSGILDRASEIFVFIQEVKFRKNRDVEIRRFEPGEIEDERLTNISFEKMSLFASSENVGIAPAFEVLVEFATSDLVLFVEEDFYIDNEVIETSLERISEAVELVSGLDADVVKLRSRNAPGEPFYPSVWKVLIVSRVIIGK
eukprot:augustus_masked-scaffold_3-processed-gene-14.7-mRNA-1 protein AED:1.00 eAED:1.00 QI:0/-1/0/0/-1/1/1/0/261